VDRTSRWPEAIPLSSISAAECAKVLLRDWISRFGVPSRITSDRGSQFTSSIWISLCNLLGIAHSRTTAYHPQSNGMVERFHRSLKVSLRARLTSADWVEHLPLVLLGLRAVPRDSLGFSASEAVFGAPLTLPGTFLEAPEMPSDQFLSKIKSVVRGFSATVPHNVRMSSSTVPASLLSAGFVFVRQDASSPSLAPLYRGPFQVLLRTDKYFKLKMGEREDTVSVDRLKPVLHEGDVLPQQPPRRGRPPRLLASPSTPSLGSRSSPSPSGSPSPPSGPGSSAATAPQLRRNPLRRVRFKSRTSSSAT